MRRFHAELYTDSRNQWRWRIFANNGKVVADSSEGYINRSDCRAIFRKLHPFMTLKEVS